MALFDFLNTGENNSDEQRNDHFSSSRMTDTGFVDSLINLFRTKPAVLKAYFGLLYDEENGKSDLFLAVDHQGEVEELKKATYFIKNAFLPAQQLFFTSKEDQPELMDFIKETNFPFYVKDKTQVLNVLIMKLWFDPTFKKSFIQQIKMSRITSLFKDFDPHSEIINFQTFIRDGKEFIPLFSEREMIFKSGMTQVPADLTVAEFDWKKIDEAVDHGVKEHFYVLNPGTSFEVAFNVELT